MHVRGFCPYRIVLRVAKLYAVIRYFVTVVVIPTVSCCVAPPLYLAKCRVFSSPLGTRLAEMQFARTLVVAAVLVSSISAHGETTNTIIIANVAVIEQQACSTLSACVIHV